MVSGSRLEDEVERRFRGPPEPQCQPIPAPVRNASVICYSARSVPSASTNAPGTYSGPSGSVSANACSSVRENASVAASYST
jgi:hypothetical protein